MASVTAHDAEGAHAQTITLVDDLVAIMPDAAAWIYTHLTQVESTLPKDFLEECAKWFEETFLSINVTSKEYTQELFHIYGIICTKLGHSEENVHMPPFTIGMKSPPMAPSMRDVGTICAAKSATEAETSLMLYHATLTTMSQWPSPKNVEKNETHTDTFAQLFQILLVFADDCLFPVTGDLYLHIVISLHIPTWKCMTYSTVAYPLLADLYGDAANAVARPYMDIPISTLLKDRCEYIEKDNVVLFVLVTTLIAELVADKTLSPVANRNILTRKQTQTPRPFVVCDFALPWLEGNDAYGFIDEQNVFHVCNGIGVANAVMAWLEACYEKKKALIIKEFSLGIANPTNPLVKYASLKKP